MTALGWFALACAFGALFVAVFESGRWRSAARYWSAAARLSARIALDLYDIHEPDSDPEIRDARAELTRIVEGAR